jgi:hypothetical protein
MLTSIKFLHEWGTPTLEKPCIGLSSNKYMHNILKQGQRNAWHMPPIGTLSEGVWKIRFREKWKIRFREKWNMVKIDDPQ